MTNFRAGLISGLIAALITSALNLICRLVGLFPDALDMKAIVTFIANPTTAFWVGLILYILGGMLIGVLFVALVKLPTSLKGVGFSLVIWLIVMLLIVPLRGEGFFGMNGGLVIPAATFVLNILYGMIVGAFAQRLVIPHDDFAEQIDHALTEALQRSIDTEAQGEVFSIDIASEKMIIFSDLHKGTRDRADDFQVAEQTYNAALGYYYYMGHRLVTLGDVEELWENRIDPVLHNYEYTLKLEAKFHQEGRYLRFWGNHDDDWSHPDQVQKYLDPIYGGTPLKIREALRIRVMDGAEELGTMFMVHGHQGTTASDRLAFLSKPVVRFLWKPFQNLTGVSLNTPSTNWQLRDQHNRAMYQWSSKQEKMIFIVGHTHRPVFLSLLHAAKIRAELEKGAEELKRNPDNPLLRESVSLLSAELEWILSQERQIPGAEGKLPAPKDELKPCHFNTGCCAFYDGDVTGIEIADGEIRLIRFPDNQGAPKPYILERASLKDVFAKL